MCGIIGSVGQSKHPDLSYILLTNLLIETKTRGTDATGFCCIDKYNKIKYSKYDLPADKFIEKCELWKKNVKLSKAMIGHDRMTTHGTEKNSINNHPHVSDDKSLSLVHNGMISSYKNIADKLDLKLQGQCDSEVILRVIEKYSTVEEGIKSFFKECSGGFSSFACLLLERQKKDCYLYAFRNMSNPIHYVDLVKELGQIIFFSTPDIWNHTVNKLKFKSILENKKIISVPDHQIFKIDISTINIQTTNIEKTNNYFHNTRYNYNFIPENKKGNDNDYYSDYFISKNNDDDDCYSFLRISNVIDKLNNFKTMIEDNIEKINDHTLKLTDSNLLYIENSIENIESELEEIKDIIEHNDNETDYF